MLPGGSVGLMSSMLGAYMGSEVQKEFISISNKNCTAQSWMRLEDMGMMLSLNMDFGIYQIYFRIKSIKSAFGKMFGNPSEGMLCWAFFRMGLQYCSVSACFFIVQLFLD